MQITGKGIGKAIGVGVVGGCAYLVGRVHGWLDAIKLSTKLAETCVAANEIIKKADEADIDDLPEEEEVEET